MLSYLFFLRWSAAMSLPVLSDPAFYTPQRLFPEEPVYFLQIDPGFIIGHKECTYPVSKGFIRNADNGCLFDFRDVYKRQPIIISIKSSLKASLSTEDNIHPDNPGNIPEPQYGTDTGVGILDEWSRIPIEVDRLFRVERHILARVYL